MKVKIEVSKMISFKRRRCADRFLNAHTVSSSSRRDPSGSNCDLYHNFSIPHDFCTHGSPHNLFGATWPHYGASSPAREQSCTFLATFLARRRSNRSFAAK